MWTCLAIYGGPRRAQQQDEVLLVVMLMIARRMQAVCWSMRPEEWRPTWQLPSRQQEACRDSEWLRIRQQGRQRPGQGLEMMIHWNGRVPCAF